MKQSPFLETIARPFDDVLMEEWEEPHPGRRLSMPNDAPTTWGSHLGGEGYRRGGMAVKRQWPAQPSFSSAFSFTAPPTKEKRFGRGRTRNMPQQLVLKNSGHSRPEVQTAPLPRFEMDYRRRCSTTASMDTCTQELPTPEQSDVNAEMSGTDSDTDNSSINSAAPPRKRIALEPLDTSFQSFQLNDLSNHLGLTMDHHAGLRHQQSYSKLGTDNAAFSVMSPDDDLYGWNAILETKPAPAADPSAPHQQRRASRSKRSLLQRVFSPGGSALDESPSNSPTSFAGFAPAAPTGR
ncbi:hypothetical protein BD289DRAFT_487191 [Coniella lustricola]|uniref:Uncharacterized protein n=1 Tax=Coniella lustricola TaxID=2025994 RepID=A0A2T2ZSM5_9PEZI|nr:hypothetical protein BD289DRAFT_487191 [Coniella lustricola]